MSGRLMSGGRLSGGLKSYNRPDLIAPQNPSWSFRCLRQLQLLLAPGPHPRPFPPNPPPHPPPPFTTSPTSCCVYQQVAPWMIVLAAVSDSRRALPLCEPFLSASGDEQPFPSVIMQISQSLLRNSASFLRAVYAVIHHFAVVCKPTEDFGSKRRWLPRWLSLSLFDVRTSSLRREPACFHCIPFIVDFCNYQCSS